MNYRKFIFEHWHTTVYMYICVWFIIKLKRLSNEKKRDIYMYKKNNASSCKGNFCLQIFIPLKKLGHPPAYTRWVVLATRRNI